MAQVTVDRQAIARFCQKHHMRRLSFFGSVLRQDFGPNSDIDMLVEFEEGHIPGYFRLMSMQRELTQIIGNRPVELRTPQELSPYFRDRVVAGAELLYVQ